MLMGGWGMERERVGGGEWRRGGDVGYGWGKFFKEVEFEVDLEGYFVILETKVTKTVPFSRIGEKGNVI